MGSPAASPSRKPQFWRIQKIKTSERDAATEWLREQVKELAVAEGQGFSLAADSERTLCATLTSYERPIPSNRSWRVDKDFIGFTPLSDPDDANVDIVAVTGLGGHALGSFRSTDGTVVWLRDFAPEDILRARFITYGYDTSIVSSDDNQGIHELARTLLDGLAIFRQRTQTQQRPLLFVCHSLGGVVLKEALVMSSKATESKHNSLHDVMLTTHGLVLMGVPNLCLRHSQLESIVKGRPNEGFVRDLQVQSDGEASQFLSSLTREFSYLDKHRQPPFEIISYYETRSSPTVALENGTFEMRGPKELMVTRTSAERIGHLARDIEHLPSQSDHRGLVRFEHSADGRNRKFVGRKEELESLQRKLFVDRDCEKVAVVGLGGIGKTQVVLHFAHLVLEEYPGMSVFWVPALSAETFEQAYRKIASLLEIPGAAEGKADVKKLVQGYISGGKAGRWMMIVDNADDMEIMDGTGANEGILQYLPEGDFGSTIFTTRDSRIAQSLAGSDVVELAKMKHPDAVDILRNTLVRKDLLHDEATTARLLNELDYLPLAMTQATAYVNCNKVSLSGYLDLLQGTEQDVVHILSTEMRDNTRYAQVSSAVAKTWLVSFKQIVQRNGDAAEILRYMSCIEWKSIPHSILPSVPPATRMANAIGILCSYSFIVPRDDEKTYDMHRLVHVAARVWVREDGVMTETQKTALEHLCDIFPSDDYNNREVWRNFIPHASRMRDARNGEHRGAQGALYLKVGRCLLVDGRTREAVGWLEESRDLRADLPENDADRLLTQHVLAMAYQADGQIKDAVRLLEQVVAIRERVLAEDHPNPLASQGVLASAYLANGQVKDAVRLLEHVVAIHKRVLAEDHPNRLVSQHQLASAYLANGRIKDAVRLLEQVVAINERVLAEDHPDRLASQGVLATAYQANGQIEKAVQLRQRAGQG
ncbi:hypothetical protein MBLNU13_g11325t2 [Cladosporium sp. NU13]